MSCSTLICFVLPVNKLEVVLNEECNIYILHCIILHGCFLQYILYTTHVYINVDFA
jgi:hypothetical protein